MHFPSNASLLPTGLMFEQAAAALMQLSFSRPKPAVCSMYRAATKGSKWENAKRKRVLFLRSLRSQLGKIATNNLSLSCLLFSLIRSLKISTFPLSDGTHSEQASCPVCAPIFHPARHFHNTQNLPIVSEQNGRPKHPTQKGWVGVENEVSCGLFSGIVLALALTLSSPMRWGNVLFSLTILFHSL